MHSDVLVLGDSEPINWPEIETQHGGRVIYEHIYRPEAYAGRDPDVVVLLADPDDDELRTVIAELTEDAALLRP